MGTRYEDQPPELWAGPESLDPTPVWKQFALIGIFLALGLVLVGGVAAFAAAPQLVAPPARVPGDRLVLPISELPKVGAPPKKIGLPWLDGSQEVWLAQPAKGDAVAVLTHWAPSPGGPVRCSVNTFNFPNDPPEGRWYIAGCPDGRAPTFNGHGEAVDKAARDLDRYLVSVSDDRVIINLGRLIVAPERTSAPPTP
jgi:hypothetical protein